MSAHAFKEWHVIVEALAAGKQILILRKGGIAEGRDGFAVKAARFWLFPTGFHAQREKTKPAAAAFFPQEFTAGNTVRLTYVAEVVKSAFLTDWKAVEALDRFHLWTEDTVRERFEWSQPPGIHALVVRVFRSANPTELPLTPVLGGCKSWVETPLHLPDPLQAAAVLTDTEFANRLAEIPF